jgi:hypothetical protein
MAAFTDHNHLRYLSRGRKLTVKMTSNTNRYAIALLAREFALLETIHRLGPCNAEQVRGALENFDLIDIIRMLHELTARGLLVRPEINEQLLYDVKRNYSEVRRTIIVAEDV